MFGKVMVRTSFKRVVDYAIDLQKDAELIASEGVLATDNDSIARCFDLQASMRPSVGNKVGHIALSFSPHDKARCTNEFMAKIALEYMERMGIKDTQYIVVRHFDHEHPHVHIVYNRINNFGKTISDSHQRDKNRVVCKELTMKYGLYMAGGKEAVNRDRLRQPDKSKYAIYDALSMALPKCTSWSELERGLAAEGISVEMVHNGQTDIIQGVIFIMEGYRFTGSKIDRKYSYSKIDKALALSRLRLEKQMQEQEKKKKAQQRTKATVRHPVHHYPGGTGRSVRRILQAPTGGQSQNREDEVGDNGQSYDDEEEWSRGRGMKM
jgi:hypothetical protein